MDLEVEINSFLSYLILICIYSQIQIRFRFVVAEAFPDQILGSFFFHNEPSSFPEALSRHNRCILLLAYHIPQS